jgi:DNA primase
VGAELAASAVGTAFHNQSLIVVRDAIAASADALERADWIDRVIAEVPATFVSLVQQLAVAPIPERDDAALTGYVRGVVNSLVDKGLLAQKADLLGRLQRADPSDRDAFHAIQRELVEVETRRRRIREE